MNTEVTITRVSHTEYTFANPSLVNSIRIVIEELVDGAYVAVETSSTLAPSDEYTYTFTDGIYRVTVETASGDTWINQDYYTIVIYEDIMACRVNFIRELVCNSDEDCGACSEKFHNKYYLYNAMNAVWDVFVLQLESLYVNQWGYSELDPDIVTALTDVQTLLDKLTTYCECLSLITDDDCGCNG